jgi:hypothetical protein
VTGRFTRIHGIAAAVASLALVTTGATAIERAASAQSAAPNFTISAPASVTPGALFDIRVSGVPTGRWAEIQGNGQTLGWPQADQSGVAVLRTQSWSNPLNLSVRIDGTGEAKTAVIVVSDSPVMTGPSTTGPNSTSPTTTSPVTTSPVTTTTVAPASGIVIDAPLQVQIGKPVAITLSGVPANQWAALSVGGSNLGWPQANAQGVATITTSLWTLGQQTISMQINGVGQVYTKSILVLETAVPVRYPTIAYVDVDSIGKDFTRFWALEVPPQVVSCEGTPAETGTAPAWSPRSNAICTFAQPGPHTISVRQPDGTTESIPVHVTKKKEISANPSGDYTVDLAAGDDAGTGPLANIAITSNGNPILTIVSPCSTPLCAFTQAPNPQSTQPQIVYYAYTTASGALARGVIQINPPNATTTTTPATTTTAMTTSTTSTTTTTTTTVAPPAEPNPYFYAVTQDGWRPSDVNYPGGTAVRPWQPGYGSVYTNGVLSGSGTKRLSLTFAKPIGGPGRLITQIGLPVRLIDTKSKAVPVVSFIAYDANRVAISTVTAACVSRPDLGAGTFNCGGVLSMNTPANTASVDLVLTSAKSLQVAFATGVGASGIPG